MALGQRLEIRQGQGLVITPQLQQAIKLLQLSSIELDAYLEGELERNPLLQREDGPAETDGEAEPARAEDTSEISLDQASDAHAAADMDASQADLYSDASPGERASEGGEAASLDGYQTGGAIDWSRAGSGGSFDNDGEGLEGALQKAKTLSEHLYDQLAVAGLDAAERAIATVLIDAVDEGGYLRADLDEVADRLGCDLA